MYPRAKGLQKSISGLKPVLTNDMERSFIVDPKVFIVWSLCNGKNTTDDIKSKFGNRIGIDNPEMDGVNVTEIITSLERIGLVET